MPLSLAIELSAVVINLKDHEAMVLCLSLSSLDNEKHMALPSGPFMPQAHRTFDLAVRAFVTQQTELSVGYVEQLYSFGDEGRQGLSSLAPQGPDDKQRVISIGYLALSRQMGLSKAIKGTWISCRHFFPWEDWRNGEPDSLKTIRPALKAWAQSSLDPKIKDDRRQRVTSLFPDQFDQWNEERVLDRYELLFSAGLVGEARRVKTDFTGPVFGNEMASDHRRILATALSRLRGKLKYRPIIFELMDETFTLLELQKSLEALSGLKLHKQNFRRALDRTGFVTPLNKLKSDTGGRPAELHAYASEASRIGPSQGLSLPRA
jgi:hypothetical protein